MKEQTFQQKRIVQLSRQLDSERQRYSKLTKQSNHLNTRLKEAHSEIEQLKEQLIEHQINNHQLQQRTREIERQNLKLKDELQKETKIRSAAEVENVRQRQIIDGLKEDMNQFEMKSKNVLYERTAQLSDKDKEIYRLKQQNLEVEKLYLNERERLQRKEEKSMRELAAVYKQFEALRRELVALKNHSLSLIEAENKRYKENIGEVVGRIEELQARLRRQEQMQGEIEELKLRLEEVIIENSQKIIQLYKYKYGG